MTLRDRIANDYFDWMVDLIGGDRYSDGFSFTRLLNRLHSTEFTYTIPRDENRAEDGIDLRYKFAIETKCHEAVEYLDGPCSVLEMMVALAIRCERDIMDDPDVGDRTGQWFWGMIVNLGLGFMTDNRYDRRTVDDVMDIFLNREYAPNGRGGLFTVENCGKDLRTVEIWYQMCWYLDKILGV